MPNNIIDACLKSCRKVLVCSVRNEAPFLMEWVAYHRLLGFERIVIAYNDCDDGSAELLNALERIGWVETIENHVDDRVAPQVAAAELLKEKADLRNGDWVLWLDADEFLNIHVGKGGVDDLISYLGNASGMLINWRIFGDGNGGRFKGSMLEEPFVLAASPQRDLSQCVKTLFRYGEHIDRLDIHRPVLVTNNNYQDIRFITGSGNDAHSGARSYRAWLGGAGSRATSRVSVSESGWGIAQINHYAVRDAEFFKVKSARGRGYKAARKGNARHDDEYWAKFNLNDVEDRTILKWSGAVQREVRNALKSIDLVETATFNHIPYVQPVRLESTTERIERPELTFPIDVAEWVKKHYQEASVILEYGSGGSTVLASEMPDKTIISVESDKDWAERLMSFFNQESPPSMPHVHLVDIGPTKAWGMPRNEKKWRMFSNYPISVWKLPEFISPDLVLIDGRFRAACFATVQFHTSKPVTVLFDDYVDRPEYHTIECWASPVETKGRMARFELTPRSLQTEDIYHFVSLFGLVR